METDINLGGFTFRLTEGVKQIKVTDYLHILKDGEYLTPQRAGAFVNLRKGKFDPIVINDTRYLFELIATISKYCGTINEIKYVPKGKVIRDMRDIKQAASVWQRNK